MNRLTPGTSDRKEGFVLLVTITLIAFMVLLLVSFTALIRVETEVADKQRRSEMAKQNALLALSVALSEVQIYTGPDQRTTARADLQHGAQVNNARWVGAYGHTMQAGYDLPPEDIQNLLTNPDYINPNGSSAQLLNWLVSGNETATFSGVNDVGATGEIITSPAVAGLAFEPDAGVINLGAGSSVSAYNDSITIGGQPARLLLGPGSVNSAVSDSGVALDYVAAPLVDISSAATIGSGSPGRYAWWVSDEGQKARANLPIPTTAAEMRNALVNAPRTAIELMSLDGVEYPQSPLDGPRLEQYDPSLPLSSIFSVRQLPFSGSNPEVLIDPFKNRFHDVTVLSNSVLSDTYAGGLKRDLSILLDPDYTPAAGDSTANTRRMFRNSRFDEQNGGQYQGYAVPTWGHLRSFAHTKVVAPGGVPEPLEPRPPVYSKNGVADDVGVGPVLTYFSLGWRFAASGTNINLNLYPLVVLWNPYSVPLAAHEYEVGYYPSYQSSVRFEVRKADQDLVSPEPDFFHHPENWDRLFNFDFLRPTGGNSNHYFRFRIDAPVIPPGESLIFSLQNSGGTYNAQNVLGHGEPEPSNFVSLNVGSFSSGTQASRVYRVATYHEGGSNYGQSLHDGGGGEAFVYLGEPSTTQALASQHHHHNPAFDLNRRWYQAHQRIGWDRIVVDHIFYPRVEADGSTVSAKLSLQQFTGGPLSGGAFEEPTFSFVTQALFSGYGNNDQLNNQYQMPTRWIAQGNMRAARSSRTRKDKNYNVLFTATAGHGTDLWQKFVVGSGGDRTSAGLGHDWMGSAPVDVTLFEFPYDDQPLLSLGQLQHANLSLVGAYPSYPLGNSLADFRLSPNLVVYSNWHDHSPVQLADEQKSYYDVSWMLNRELWDQFYFSGSSATNGSGVLDNARHIAIDEESLQDPDLNAAHLLLTGGFNINSTSEQAWRAVLGGLNQMAYDPQNPTSSAGSTMLSALARFSRPTGSTDVNEMWSGYRALDENEISRLARNIVEEVRVRGPFVSLGDFVNRRLVDNPASALDERLKGTLQAAIDATIDPGEYPANDRTLGFWADDLLVQNPGTKADQQATFTDGAPAYHWNHSRGSNIETTLPLAARSAFGPKFLTQADILSTIGSSLSARSDTFVIRTYGEITNPLLDDGDNDFVVARAWCEAVVQRIPEYMDGSDAVVDAPHAQLNRQFGRKYQIVSFRWLSPSEI